MQELLIVNPAKRPSKRKATKRKASPKQIAARKKFAAMVRARAGKSPAKRSSPRKANPIMATKRRKARRSNPVKATVKRVTRRRNPVARVAKRSRRRNPISLGGGSLRPMALLKPAFIGALGATAVNTILGKLPLPAAAFDGKMRFVTRGVAAIALGMIASKLGARSAIAAQMAEGSLTVTLHDMITEYSSDMGMALSGFPNPTGARLGYFAPGTNATRGGQQRVGAYVSGPGAKLGAYTTGPGSNVMQMSGRARGR